MLLRVDTESAPHILISRPNLTFSGEGKKHHGHRRRQSIGTNGHLSCSPPSHPAPLHCFFSRFQSSFSSPHRVLLLHFFFTTAILINPNPNSNSSSLFSIYLLFSFAELMEYDPRIARLIFSQPDTYLQLFDDAALWAHVSRISLTSIYSFTFSYLFRNK